LRDKCQEKNIKLKIVNESYTSKTCGKCGEINQDLGASKNFKCEKCGLETDRDYNGSRNILIKNINKIIKL